MSFSYDPTLPNPPDDPADDVDQMQVNSQSISDLIEVDHVGFNDASGGEHKEVTFNNKNVPAAPTDPKSILYTNSGTISTVSQLLYRNQNAIFPVSALRAFVNFTGVVAAGALTINTSYNIASVVKAAGNVVTITLSAGVTDGDNVCVLYTSNGGEFFIPTLTYTFVAGVLTFTRAGGTMFGSGSTLVNVAIFQF